MGNRRKLKPWRKKESKVKCPQCKGTEFDVMANYGELNGVMHDALACRRCTWTGAVPSHKVRTVKG